MDGITEHIHVFEPTAEKIAVLITKLLGDYLWTSDEFRNENTVRRIVGKYIMDDSVRLYEYGDFESLIFVKGIIPGWKADVALKIIDPKFWGKTAVREFRKFIDYLFKEFNFKRISTSTADERMVTVARLTGFSEEGRYPLGFMWDGRLFDDIYLGIVRED